MRVPDSFSRLPAAVLLVVFGGACFAQTPKVLPSDASLVLAEDLCATVANGHGGVKYEVGKSLCSGLEPGLKDTFTALTRLDRGPAPGAPHAGLVLIPNFVDFVFDIVGGEFDLVVAVEWTVQDRQGRLVWLQTVTGETHAKARTRRDLRQKLIPAAVADLAKNTASAFLRAPEIARAIQQ
jgi:hypothetical protein